VREREIEIERERERERERMVLCGGKSEVKEVKKVTPNLQHTTFADNLNAGPSYKASEEAGEPKLKSRSCREEDKGKKPPRRSSLA
jgi:hypothetical protein